MHAARTHVTLITFDSACHSFTASTFRTGYCRATVWFRYKRARRLVRTASFNASAVVLLCARSCAYHLHTIAYATPALRACTRRQSPVCWKLVKFIRFPCSIIKRLPAADARAPALFPPTNIYVHLSISCPPPLPLSCAPSFQRYEINGTAPLFCLFVCFAVAHRYLGCEHLVCVCKVVLRFNGGHHDSAGARAYRHPSD